MKEVNDYVEAGDQSASSEKLWNLYKKNCSRVKQRLAENPVSPEDLLRLLARDKNPDVRAAVASNDNTPPDLLEELSLDEDVNVRLILANEIKLPVYLLEWLARDDNPYVADRAESTLDILYLEEQLLSISFVCEPGHVAKIGQLFLEAGIIIEADLELCLSMSKTQEIPIGQILVRHKQFDPEVVLFALRMQTFVRTGKISFKGAVDKLQKYAEVRMLLAS